MTTLVLLIIGLVAGTAAGVVVTNRTVRRWTAGIEEARTALAESRAERLAVDDVLDLAFVDVLGLAIDREVRLVGPGETTAKLLAALDRINTGVVLDTDETIRQMRKAAGDLDATSAELRTETARLREEAR